MIAACELPRVSVAMRPMCCWCELLAVTLPGCDVTTVLLVWSARCNGTGGAAWCRCAKRQLCGCAL
eukprot:8315561-Alexandrium_andersonii.AAC.1